MKIGITCYPTYGGTGVVATELGIELAARGHEIHFITYSQPFRLTGREANIHFHEVAVSNYPALRTPALRSRPRHPHGRGRRVLLARSSPRPLRHPALGHRAARPPDARLARPSHLPFITTLHGTDITLVGLDRSYLPITRFGIEQSDGVTAISSYLRDRTREAFDINSEIEVIRNFVNCDVYIREPELVAAMRPRFAEPDERLLVHLSNFRPVKRVQDVVEVFARVARAMPARLMLIGDGPDRTAAEYLARDHGVQDRIHFLGKQDNVNELLPLADLMLMPSEMESFGLAALEAMACSVPTIATRVGGVPELIRRRRQRPPLRRRRHRGHGHRRHRPAQRSSLASKRCPRPRRKTAQDHFCASRIIPLYEDYYDRVVTRTQPNH